MNTPAATPRPQKSCRPLLHLPEANWPQVDRLRFAAAFDQPHDIFSDDGGGNHLKPRTKTALSFGYRRWLGWIAKHHPGLMTAAPERRATPDKIRDYAAHLRLTCRERTLATQIRLLHDALRYMYPNHDWAWLREIKARLERAIPKSGRKPIQITSQAVIDRSLDRLDEVEAAYDALAPTAQKKSLQSLALRYRDGLLVAFVSFLPLRRSNLAGLQIGSTISRGAEVWRVHIPGEMVKNGEPIEADLPAWISERIDRFVEVTGRSSMAAPAKAACGPPPRGVPPRETHSTMRSRTRWLAHWECRSRCTTPAALPARPGQPTILRMPQAPRTFSATAATTYSRSTTIFPTEYKHHGQWPAYWPD